MLKTNQQPGIAHHCHCPECRADRGAECDCPDFEFHRKGLDNGPCKPVAAVRACGLI
jgi:hypothetical protein